MITLFALTGSCSLVPHMLLRMTDAPFELRCLNRDTKEQKSPEYLSINPRGKVPALRVDDVTITENVAIQNYIADRFPQLELAPTDAVARSEWLSFLAWCSNTVHPAFRRFMRPDLLTPERQAYPSLKETGTTEFLSCLTEIDQRLSARQWIMGETFSTADAYAHVFHLWARRMEFHVDHLKNLKRHGQAMMLIPAVRAAFAKEEMPLHLFG